MASSITLHDLHKHNDTLWEIPRSFCSDMRVPAYIVANETLLASLFKDKSLQQLINVTTLPGLCGKVLVMPDAHEGYGFPIGGVAATLFPDGVISPGGIGYDINCGIRLLLSQLTLEPLKSRQADLAQAIYRAVPSGVGRGGALVLSSKKLDAVLRDGANWALANGYATEQDLWHMESHGVLTDADPRCVSQQAKARGHAQLGTLGSGNHFVEVDTVSEIFDTDIAQRFGLFEGQLVILIHTGSRGLGHQVATDYIRRMLKNLAQHHITLPDRELACAPLSSQDGSDYFKAMSCAANFAWANRQLITHHLRQVWQQIFPEAPQLNLLYDVAHNIAKIEQHQVDGVLQKLIVHRKGATRAFGPGHPELAAEFQQTGQPVIIPGSMGTASYVLAGTQTAMLQSFGTSCHGAGRNLSRHEAKRRIQGAALKQQLANEGIMIATGSLSGLAEEAPLAYKDVNNVVNVVHDAGIAKKVAKLVPRVVIKG